MKLKNLWIGLGLGALLVVLIVWGLCRLIMPGRYVVTTLPSLGGDFTRATGINEKGQVVGVSRVAQSRLHLFLWDPVHGTRDLGFSGSYAEINDHGQITGITDVNHVSEAFFWDPNDGLCLLGTMGGQSSHGVGINNRGQVTGFYIAVDEELHAFVWDRVNGVQIIDVPGCDLHLAWSINDAGQVIVHGANDSYVITLDEGGNVVASEQLPTAGMWGINNTGHVAGVTQSAPGECDLVIWQAGTGARTLRVGASDGDHVRINDAGRVIYARGPGKPMWFLSILGIQPPEYYLVNLKGRARPIPLIVPTEEDERFTAAGINNRGQIIGTIRSNRTGSTRSVLLEPKGKR